VGGDKKTKHCLALTQAHALTSLSVAGAEGQDSTVATQGKLQQQQPFKGTTRCELPETAAQTHTVQQHNS
jgi:hypothetical protein